MSLFKPHIKLKQLFSTVDIVLLIMLAALVYGLIGIASEWREELHPVFQIDLSPWALPTYTLFSLFRGFAAYGFSLLFTLIYGYIAAYSRRAEAVMIPLLDILQSIPVLGFLPGLVLGLIALFPHRNIGLELATILMIFTGQVWNMAFSFYHSLKSIPTDLREVSRIYKLSRWERILKLEIPFSMMGLVWNSMMSMAGGWFFLTVSESFVLENKDFRLPGIGSYMSVAISEGDIPAMIYAIIAMALMIVAVDQLFWRPIVAWAQKFKFEETESSEVQGSFILDLYRHSYLFKHLLSGVRRFRSFVYFLLSQVKSRKQRLIENGQKSQDSRIKKRLFMLAQGFILGISLFLTVYGIWRLSLLLSHLSFPDWLNIGLQTFLTFLRVFGAVALGTLWTVPVGVSIGLSPRWSRVLQPVIQVIASFPAPMLFPLVLMGVTALGGGIEYGAIVLMLLGTQWYILFNVIAGAMAIPYDMREAAAIYKLQGWKKWRKLILPAIFPNLVTGWVTATGGAWNASIVAEYVRYKGTTLIATGLGATISLATDQGNFALLAASLLAMSTTVIGLNRFFWKRLYKLAEERYSLNK